MLLLTHLTITPIMYSSKYTEVTVCLGKYYLNIPFIKQNENENFVTLKRPLVRAKMRKHVSTEISVEIISILSV